ncbi:MAG: hypothetical protein JSS67_02330 [Bacteroidetes bacterium]|nr:hypothetical protein [Bacteroidota bacterium]
MSSNSISAKEFCMHYQVEYHFFYSLYESGLVSVSGDDAALVMDEEEIPKVEKIIRLHEELGINLEGIEAILPLIEKIELMQAELKHLRNHLNLLDEEKF